MTTEPRVFISYSRQDGEAIAHDVRQILTEQGIKCWHDRTDMEGGRNWWKQITEALETVSFMVLVATPGAMDSPIVRREWQYARQQGVCIYPLTVPEYPLDFTLLPHWMQKAHFYDLSHEQAKFIQHLAGDCTANRVPFMPPQLPDNYVARPVEIDELLEYFLDDLHENPMATSVALLGGGGFGKTTLATALCHDDRIINAYDEGVLWVSLGKAPDLLAEVTKVYRAIAGDERSFIDVDEASQHLAERLADWDFYLVIDDVWHMDHLAPFMRGGDNCARLITTRNFDVARQGKHRLAIEQMQSDEAVQLLTTRLGEEVDDLAPFQKLANRLGDHPLMLGLVCDALDQRIERGDDLAGALTWVNKALDRRGMEAFDSTDIAQRNRAISHTIDMSVELLTAKERPQYFQLAIFPEDEAIPLNTAGALWDLDEFDTEALLERLFDLSLLKFDIRAGEFSLHDVLRVYMQDHLSNAAELHSQLVASWDDLFDLPDDYAWYWLGYHLMQGEQADTLRQLLLDFEWLLAKLEATDINTLLLDFDRYLAEHDDTALRLIQNALRNASHVVIHDKSQLAGQLIGRLISFEDESIQALLASTREYGDSPWLEPVTACLPQADSALLRTISGHSKSVSDVWLTADGQTLLSASSDGTIRFWSLTNGIELSTLELHDGKKVQTIVMSEKERYLISGGSDHTICVFDLDADQEVHRLVGHDRIVTSVALSPDEKWLASGSTDYSVRLWNMQSGECVAIFEHESLVSAVRFSVDGQAVVSSSADKTVRAWDIEELAQTTILPHEDMVNTLEFSPNGSYLFTGLQNGTVTAWDWLRQKQVGTWPAHTKAVKSLAVNSDENMLISISDDLSLKGWSLRTHTQIFELADSHTWPPTQVIISPNGELAISAAADHTIKVWRLSAIRSQITTTGHTDRVNSLALMNDNRYAISAASDDTLKVWDLETCTVHRTLEGHLKRVNAVTVPSAGRFGVSVGSDGMLKVWDVVSGLEARSFKAHARDINAVAITPNGQRVITGSSDGTLRVWNVATVVPLLSFKDHSKRVNAVAITPDGKVAISASGTWQGQSGEICIWEIKTGICLANWSGHSEKVNALTLTPNSKRIITAADDGLLKVWDRETQAELLTLRGHSERVNAVTLSSDGELVLSAGDDGRLIIWDLATGEAFATYTADDALFACVMSDNGETILTAGTSGKVHFLKLRR